jgi:type I restriction enzyme R subunit
MSKLSERDVCSKFITPLCSRPAGTCRTQIREEVSFTKGRIIVRGKLHSRGKGKRADYVLYYKPNQPIALIEAKDQTHSLGRHAARPRLRRNPRHSLRLFQQRQRLPVP